MSYFRTILLILAIATLVSIESTLPISKPFVFRFKTANINNEEISCLMFMSDNPKIGYTAYHCLSDQVKCYNLKLFDSNQAICKKILYQNPDKDIAVFELKEELTVGPAFVKIEKKTPLKFQVFEHQSITQNDCEITQENEWARSAVLQDAYNNPKKYTYSTARCKMEYGLGDSGSPVVTEKGIIGLAFAHSELIGNEVSWMPIEPEDVFLNCDNEKLLKGGTFFCDSETPW